MNKTFCPVLAVALLLAAPASAQDAPAFGLQTGQVMRQDTPFARNAEMARRLLTPLLLAQMNAGLKRAAETLGEQPLDPGLERFLVYVPPGAPPPEGYNLLVFVPPWDGARLPPGWTRVLDAHAMILVMADRSGNRESILGRRMPLALIGAANVMARYTVNPAHVFVSGFSGGSRVAMRLALGYPDLFRGALLGAGSDPIGSPLAPIPPAQLFARFQAESRLVYLTGQNDLIPSQGDIASMKSMRSWCVFNLDEVRVPDRSHQLADPGSLERSHQPADPGSLGLALDALLAPLPPPTPRLAACRADLASEMDAQFQKLDGLVAAGKRDEARALLKELDGRFGGLAAPRSLAAAAGLDSRGAAP